MSNTLQEYVYLLPKIHLLKCFVDNNKQYSVSYLFRKVKVNMKKCRKIMKISVINNFEYEKTQEIFKIYTELIKINHRVKMTGG